MARFDEVAVSDRVNRHINGKHGISADEVAEVLADHDLVAEWAINDKDEAYLQCRGHTERGRNLAVTLYPADESLWRWRLATAFPVV